MNGGRLRSAAARLRGEWHELRQRFAEPVPLPFDAACPVVYDKDDHRNCYTDELVLALASAGRIRLEGLLTSSAVAPFNPAVSVEDYESFVAGRRRIVEAARASGFRGIPDPVRGTMGHLRRPGSGRIEDTRPLGSPGSRLIVQRAAAATPARPLVLLMCGPLTVAADAYLLDPAIANRVVVAWFGGTPTSLGDYNGWSDPWAAFVVLQRLRLVQFPADGPAGRTAMAPVVPKSRLATLPDTELRRLMVAKRHPNGQPGSYDADAPPVVALVRRDYVTKVERMTFDRWLPSADPDHAVPGLRGDPDGRALVVHAARRSVATAEWWRALADPAAYGTPVVAPRERTTAGAAEGAA